MKRTAAVTGALLAALIIHTGVAAGSAATPVRWEPAPSATNSLARTDDPALKQLLKQKRWDDALERALELLAEDPTDSSVNEAAGDACVELGRIDDAALYYDTARRSFRQNGKDKRAKGVQRKLQGIDPQGKATRSFFSKVRKDLSKSALALIDEGEYGMGAAILARVLPYAKDSDRKKFEELVEKHGGGGGAIDIDASGSGSADASRKLIKQTTAHYQIRAHLEPEVIDLLGRTMDSIFDYYVEIYLDGDHSRANFPKATLYIYPTWEKMAEQYPGEKPSPGLGGWWSPSENMVVSYDTRDRHGTLDELVGTLFHEASHQFMTFLSTRGGKSPAWLNEGTSSFFEGATAMKDGSVLWPDATLQRLRTLNHFLTKGGGPLLSEVLAFDERGSYGGNYYCFGWGLIYFLMEYEDEDMNRPFRALYSDYRERMTTEGGVPDELFEEIFLGSNSPLGHETLKDFEKDWTRWILDEVKPLHMGASHRKREARLIQADRYFEAAEEIIAEADVAAGGSKKKKSKSKKKGAQADRLQHLNAEQRDLVSRYFNKALGHVVYVREEIDDIEEDEADLELLEMEMKIVSTMGRHGHEAILIAKLLELHEDGMLELTPDEAEDYEKRLMLLDKRNAALRLAKKRTKELVRLANKIVVEYQELEPPMPKRAAGFAREAAEALDDPGLLVIANLLGGGSMGATRALFTKDASQWTSILDAANELRFEPSNKALAIESASDAFAGRACAAASPAGDYELECTVERANGAEGGLIISAGAEEWILIGIDADGGLAIRSASLDEGELEWSEWPLDEPLDPPVTDGESVSLRVRVMREEGDLFIQVGDREELETYWSGELPESLSTGVYSRGGLVTLHDTVLRDVVTTEEEEE